MTILIIIKPVWASEFLTYAFELLRHVLTAVVSFSHRKNVEIKYIEFNYEERCRKFFL